MVWVPLVPMKSVYPSGSARAASAAARLPPAPTLFSTTTDCPSSALRVLGQKARREVGAASGGKRHHDANGPAWAALRQRPSQMRTSRRGEQDQDLATSIDPHAGSLPITV